MAIERHECEGGAFHTIQGLLDCGRCTAVLANTPPFRGIDDEGKDILVCQSCGSEFHPDELADARVEEILERVNRNDAILSEQVRILREALADLCDSQLTSRDREDAIARGLTALEATEEGA